MKYIYILLGLLFITFATTTQADAAGKLINYPVGTCKQIGGGLWQQMPDGTWADPNDKLNYCNIRYGQNWMNNLYNNPWMRAGFDQTNGLGNMSQADWFQRCLMMQSILPREECQGVNGWYSNDSSWANDLSWYPRVGRQSSQFLYADNNQVIQAEIPGKPNGLSSALFGIALGFVFNQLTN